MTYFRPLSLTLCATLLAGCVTTTPPAPTPPAPSSAPQAATAQPAAASGMAALLSSERAAQGRSALREDPRLSAAAQAHAEDMVAQGYFSHQGRNGARFTDRARAAGYGCARAENIAFGQSSEAAVVAEWMGSEGHRRNILLQDARDFGIGRAGNTWVLKLGRGC